MIDLIKSWFALLGAMFSELLTHPEFAAVVVATIAAISVTQTVKMVVIQSNMPNGGKGLWYLVTTFVGLAVTTILWPSKWGFMFGLGVGGVFAPGVYILVTRSLYRFWPDLKYKISATPKGN